MRKLKRALAQYHEKEKEAESLDKEEFTAKLMKIRPEKETEARKIIETKVSDISEYDFNRSVDTVSKLIGEAPPHYLTKAEIAQQEEYDRCVKQQEERRKQIEERRKNKTNKNINKERSR